MAARSTISRRLVEKRPSGGVFLDQAPVVEFLPCEVATTNRGAPRFVRHPHGASFSPVAHAGDASGEKLGELKGPRVTFGPPWACAAPSSRPRPCPIAS